MIWCVATCPCQVHKSTRSAPNHSCPYVSLQRRIHEIENAIEQDPRILSELAGIIDRCRAPASALRRLDLARHPSTPHIMNCRDPLHAKIIYHADPYILHSLAPPQVLPGPDDGGGGGAPIVAAADAGDGLAAAHAAAAEPCGDLGSGSASSASNPCGDGGGTSSAGEPCGDGGSASSSSKPCYDGGSVSSASKPSGDGGSASSVSKPIATDVVAVASVISVSDLWTQFRTRHALRAVGVVVRHFMSRPGASSTVILSTTLRPGVLQAL